MTAPDRRWVAFVAGEDRTGTFTALASVFSSRGVGFESMATHDGRAGVGLVVIVFTASERIQRVLARTLARLAVTRGVEVRAADDPAVRAVGVVHVAEGASFRPPVADGVRCSGDPSQGEPVLVEGPFAGVEGVLDAARAAGVATVASVIQPLRD